MDEGTRKLGNAIGAAALVGGGLALLSGVTARTAEAMVPADGRFVEVRGARLHVVDTGGDRPAIVMLHGLYGQLRNFSYALADRLSDRYRLVLVDRPGWGHSTVEGGHQTIFVQARMIAELIRELDLRRPMVVGHSMGGAVALALGMRDDAELRGLALVAPFTQPQDEAPPVFRASYAPAAIRGLVAWTLAVPVGALAGPAVARRIFAPDPVPGDFPVRGGGLLTARPQAFEAGSFELEHARGSAEALVRGYPDLRVPTAILYGRDDRLIDPALHGDRTAAAIPGATIDRTDGGHMLPVTHPDAVAAWIASVDARWGA